MKNEKRNRKLPAVGQRIVRSSIAVALCFVLYYIRGKQGIPFYSALAVLQCIQPYNFNMKEMAKKRTIGTFVGAFWGTIVIYYLHYREVSMQKSKNPLRNICSFLFLQESSYIRQLFLTVKSHLTFPVWYF